MTRLTRRQFSALTLAAVVGAAIPVASRAQNTATDPMAAAEEMSRLENTEHIPALYTLYSLMHPDAQAIIPRATVIGWYQADFQPRGPQDAVATGVTTLPSWTWPVTNVAYQNVAEVSFTQSFADGTAQDDVVRLVMAEGKWRWFFGRDRDWVMEQIDRFDQRLHVAERGTAPYGLDAITTIDAAALNQMPANMAFATGTKSLQVVNNAQPRPWESDVTGVRYRGTAPEDTVGFVSVGMVREPTTAAESLQTIVGYAQDAPPFTLHAWNTAPASGLAYAAYQAMGSEAVGDAQFVALTDGTTTLTVSALNEAALQTIVDALLAVSGS